MIVNSRVASRLTAKILTLSDIFDSQPDVTDLLDRLSSDMSVLISECSSHPRKKDRVLEDGEVLLDNVIANLLELNPYSAFNERYTQNLRIVEKTGMMLGLNTAIPL